MTRYRPKVVVQSLGKAAGGLIALVFLVVFIVSRVRVFEANPTEATILAVMAGVAAVFCGDFVLEKLKDVRDPSRRFKYLAGLTLNKRHVVGEVRSTSSRRFGPSADGLEIVLWAADEATARQLCSDKYYLLGALMQGGAQREILEALDAGAEYTCDHSRADTGGYAVRIVVHRSLN